MADEKKITPTRDVPNRLPLACQPGPRRHSANMAVASPAPPAADELGFVPSLELALAHDATPPMKLTPAAAAAETRMLAHDRSHPRTTTRVPAKMKRGLVRQNPHPPAIGACRRPARLTSSTIALIVGTRSTVIAGESA